MLFAPVFACSFDGSGIDTVDGGADNFYQCVCDCEGTQIFDTGNPEQSADDAEEILATGEMLVDGTFLDLGESPQEDPQITGMRFSSLGIPRNSTIVSAQIQFTTRTGDTEFANLLIQGEATGNAAPFSGDNGDVSERDRTAAIIAWNPPGWEAEGEAGPDQLTPDLAPIVQSIVSREDWSAENAMAILVTGTGRRSAVPFDEDPDAAPRLRIDYVVPRVSLSLPVCGGEGVDFQDAGSLTSDCQNRVMTTVSNLSGECGYPDMCNCTVMANSTGFSDECIGDCTEDPVNADCSDFDPVGGDTSATNAEGDAPVCTSGSALAAVMYGRRSTCEVSGTSTIEVEGRDRTPSTAGIVQLLGGPCPDGGCAVGLEYDLDILEDITFGNIFKSETFRDLAGVGHTLPGQRADVVSGQAIFTPFSTTISGSGSRGSETMGVVGTNGDVIDLFVDWSFPEPMCKIEGSLLGSVDPELQRCEPEGPDANAVCETDADCTDDPACTDEICNCTAVESADATLSVDVEGDIINQPPEADAGDDLTVECNLPGRASFELDASASFDPDGNAASFAWLLGSRAGPREGFQPVTRIEQDLDTTVPHVFRIIDTHGQSDEDTVTATVEDTTAPAITCNTPSTMTPRDAPASFTSFAGDTCDTAPTAEITTFDCFKVTRNGKVIDETKSCHVTVDGDELTIRHAGGVGHRITWRVRAEDASGNQSVKDCEIRVVRPGGRQ